MRFSPLPSALSASERFSLKDLFQISFFFFFFLKDNRGASMRFSPLPPALGASERFSPKDLYYYYYYYYYYIYIYIYILQGIPKAKAEPFSMTNTDFSIVLMNSCLERGLL